MVVDEQGFIDEEVSDETLYVTIDGRTVPMATANILKLEGVDVPQGVRAARVMEIERRYEDRYNAETMPAAAAVSAAPAAPKGTNVSEVSPVWAEVAADEAYRNIWNDDSRMASEVLARLSGGENYRRTMQEATERENDAARKFSLIAAWGRVKRALAKFWNKVREMLDLPVNGEPGNAVPAWEWFVNSAIGDFYRGVNPNVGNSSNESSDGIRFRMGRGSSNANSERLTKQSVEQGFGGIWLDDLTEYRNFTSAAISQGYDKNENYVYAGGNFYLYYINNEYDFIPYVAIEANRENKEIIEALKNIIENDGQRERTQQDIGRRTILARSKQADDIGTDKRNSGRASATANGGLVGRGIRTGKYLDAPWLYTKVESVEGNREVDSANLQEDDDIRYRATDVDAEAERTDAEITAAVGRLSTELNTPVENAGSIGFRYCLHTFCMKIKAMRYSHFPIVEWWQVKH